MIHRLKTWQFGVEGIAPDEVSEHANPSTKKQADDHALAANDLFKAAIDLVKRYLQDISTYCTWQCKQQNF